MKILKNRVRCYNIGVEPLKQKIFSKFCEKLVIFGSRISVNLSLQVLTKFYVMANLAHFRSLLHPLKGETIFPFSSQMRYLLFSINCLINSYHFECHYIIKYTYNKAKALQDISLSRFGTLFISQGLFATPNCSNEDINEIGCISAYCYLPGQVNQLWSQLLSSR